MRYMQTLRVRRAIAIWLAAVAVFFGALAPSISHAVGAGHSSTWVEICSLQGTKLVRVGDGDREPIPVTKHLLEHCPYCSLHMPSLALPPSGSSPLVLLDLRDDFPVAFFSASRTLYAWVSAQPRAPPLSF
jgi:hypothetical protein